MSLKSVFTTVIDGLKSNSKANAFAIVSTLLAIALSLITGSDGKSGSCFTPAERSDAITVILGLLAAIEALSVLVEDPHGVTNFSMGKLQLWWKFSSANRFLTEMDAKFMLTSPSKLRAIPVWFVFFKIVSNFFLTALSVLLAVTEEGTVVKPGCNGETYDDDDAALKKQDELRDLLFPFLCTAIVATLFRIVLYLLYEEYRDKRTKMCKQAGYNLTEKALSESHPDIQQRRRDAGEFSNFQYYSEQTKRLALAAALLVGDVGAIVSKAQTKTGEQARLLLRELDVIKALPVCQAAQAAQEAQALTQATPLQHHCATIDPTDPLRRLPPEAILVDIEADSETAARRLAKLSWNTMLTSTEHKLLGDTLLLAHKQALQLLRQDQANQEAQDIIQAAQAFFVAVTRERPPATEREAQQPIVTKEEVATDEATGPATTDGDGSHDTELHAVDDPTITPRSVRL
eukprot:m.22807 g.22807  ORF g.22807 m.22807 type:complete len:460 (-) comp11298_c0_seq2:45-1424(-)